MNKKTEATKFDLFRYENNLSPKIKNQSTSLFSVISDINIDKNNDSIEIIFDKWDKNVTLIIAGNLGIVGHKTYKRSLEYICSIFTRVILIPGEREFYHNNDMLLTYDSVVLRLREIEKENKNLKVLIDDNTYVNDVLIHGSTFWSYCPHQYYKEKPILKHKNELWTCGDYNYHHINAKLQLSNCISYCSEYKITLLIATSYSPTFKGTLKYAERKLEMKDLYMKASNSDELLDNDVIKKWVYGNTGYNGCYGKLMSCQYGTSDLSYFNRIWTLDEKIKVNS